MPSNNKNTTHEQTDSGRRRFIAGLTVVGGLAATNAAVSGTALSGTTTDDSATVATGQDSEPLGYQNSDHVQAYYRSLKD